MEYEIQKCIDFCQETIDGYSGFLFSTAEGKTYSAAAVNNAIHRITKTYNKEEEVKAKLENRNSVFLPSFSAHNLRHTFSSRLCEAETNVKVIQEIMGHADITTTMNIYAEITQEKKQDVMAGIQGKIIMK